MLESLFSHTAHAKILIYFFDLGCINAANRTNNKTQSIQQMASAKMTVKSMVSKVKVCEFSTLFINFLDI